MQYITSTFAGLALGRQNAHSAVAVIDVVEDVSNRRDPVSFEFYKSTRLQLREVQHVAIEPPFTDISAKLRPVVLKPPPGHFGPRLNATIAVDTGGPAAPVLEMLRKTRLDCNVIGAVLGGNTPGMPLRDGAFLTTRPELAGLLRFLLQNKLLHFPESLQIGGELLGELAAMETGDGESKHRETALAIALALWVIPKRQPTLFQQLAA